MSRKLVVTLFAILFAVVTAWADPGGGEGGCVNLPGGRSGGRPGMSSAGGSFEARVAEVNGVRLMLPNELQGAAALVRIVDLPFAFWMSTDKDRLQVPAQLFSILRSLGLAVFTIDLVTHGGEHMHVQMRLEAGSQVQVLVR